MRIILSLALLLVAVNPSFSQTRYGEPLAAAIPAEAPRTLFTPSEVDEVRARLATMTSIIGKHDHPVTESYIQSYVLRQREKAETILGRLPTYFPLFERELRRAGLPDDLKYLAVVESALDPTARSRSGAGGLWQFMPGTAEMFDLTVNNTIDERSDVEKSTRAAVKFLKDEYARFGDWALVLAAYNAGPGRVRRAMRRSGSRDFWTLRRYLPRETRNYVPAFVAAMYLHEYGHAHGVRPATPSLDEQLVTAVPTPFGASLLEVAQATELSLDLIEALNPHCRAGFVPAGRGATCRVPSRTAASLTSYLRWRVEGGAPELVAEVQSRAVTSGLIPRNDHLYTERSVVLPAGESTRRFAEAQGVSVHHLELWNGRLPARSPEARSLTVFEPRFVPATPFAERPKLRLDRVATRRPTKFYVAPPRVPRAIAHELPNATVRLGAYESLLEAWQPYSATTSWSQFVQWNGLDAGSLPKPGAELRIRK